LTPTYCRREAFDTFRQHLPNLADTNALLRAATAVAMHENPRADADLVLARVDQLADTVRARLHDPRPRALLAHLHHVLFEDEGFAGDRQRYHDPVNSYLPNVLERRRGLPILLSLVYKAVAQRLGLEVDGIAAPYHFMAAVHLSEANGLPAERLLIDAFHGGRLLTHEEAFHLVGTIVGQQVPRDQAILPRCGPEPWLYRILQNLVFAFERQGRDTDRDAMRELQQLLGATG
jgi:regulator of sirC expression with transglutaminase-like and TPR domain